MKKEKRVYQTLNFTCSDFITLKEDATRWERFDKILRPSTTYKYKIQSTVPLWCRNHTVGRVKHFVNKMTSVSEQI